MKGAVLVAFGPAAAPGYREQGLLKQVASAAHAPSRTVLEHSPAEMERNVAIKSSCL